MNDRNKGHRIAGEVEEKEAANASYKKINLRHV